MASEWSLSWILSNCVCVCAQPLLHRRESRKLSILRSRFHPTIQRDASAASVSEIWWPLPNCCTYQQLCIHTNGTHVPLAESPLIFCVVQLLFFLVYAELIRLGSQNIRHWVRAHTRTFPRLTVAWYANMSAHNYQSDTSRPTIVKNPLLSAVAGSIDDFVNNTILLPAAEMPAPSPPPLEPTLAEYPSSDRLHRGK